MPPTPSKRSPKATPKATAKKDIDTSPGRTVKSQREYDNSFGSANAAKRQEAEMRKQARQRNTSGKSTKGY